ncbi:MAG: hypothetical protein BM564_09185 [Bacteroidetes bacterium MedPE-SWsnd-G2]|nr:MAG: hypothetical protein BM564_09185 [Bacteroidetes bacterium MedPE-SWsnd-G2]
METELLIDLKAFFKNLLNNNMEFDLSPEFMLACSKVVFYLEHFEAMSPSEPMTICSSYKTSDQYNSYTHKFCLGFENNSISISSKHCFDKECSEGLSSIEEIVFPNPEFSFRELKDSFRTWRNGFYKGLNGKLHYSENFGEFEAKPQIFEHI